MSQPAFPGRGWEVKKVMMSLNREQLLGGMSEQAAMLLKPLSGYVPGDYIVFLGSNIVSVMACSRDAAGDDYDTMKLLLNGARLAALPPIPGHSGVIGHYDDEGLVHEPPLEPNGAADLLFGWQVPGNIVFDGSDLFDNVLPQSFIDLVRGQFR